MKYRKVKLKKKSGGTRNITAPDAALKRYQQKALLGLEQDYHKLIKNSPASNIAHGFIRGRNVVTAAKQHIGYKTTIMMDIKEFFDTVHIEMFDEWHQDPYLFTADTETCGQGFPTSPMMANIAFIKPLEVLNDMLEDTLQDFVFTMYADDIQISINTEEYDKINNTIINVTNIINSFGFEINAKKTRVRYAKRGWRKILGVNVGDREIRASRVTMKKIRAAEYQENLSSLDGLNNWASCAEPKRRT